ncbi:hypothetical protein BBJ28_00019240 [Nothophytophthora sp. Chile5]|nr:hypothetical protein BBJ28_00020196 [Nothophytophthora sp. Chile5]RLN89852.1 hypothetical protein BBJ28_00019240 [Nothophytophthora sp. Chile5]
MKDCLKTILTFQRRKGYDYNTRTLMPGSQPNINYGEETNQVLGTTTEWKPAQHVFVRITTELTDLTDDKFLAALGNLEGWCSNLRQDDVAVPPSAADAHEGEEEESQVPPTQIAADTEADPDFDEKDAQIHGSGAGAFSEQKLLAMEYLWNLAKTCKNASPDVDDQFEGEGAVEVTNELLGSSPHDKLVGFGFDVEWEHLYCTRTESWYNDTFINAFLTTLATKYRNNTTLFLPPLSIPVPRNGRRVPVTTLSMLSDADEDFVLVPINLNRSHWACLLVDRANKNVVCHDSVNKRSHSNLLMELATELVSKSFTDLNTPYTIHSPIQKSSDSCGLFRCLFFWKRIHKDAGKYYLQEGILRRRWDILRAIVAFNTESKNNSEVDLQ